MTVKNILFTSFIASLLCMGSACAESQSNKAGDKTTASTAVTPETATDAKDSETRLAVTDESFESVKESVEMAITDRGLIISGTMHISDMLNRTGKDLGITEPIFKKAEGLEFCSAAISHKMAQVDPGNVAMCPFTVVIYQLNSNPDETHVGYQRIRLNGDGAAVEKEILEIMQGIVDDSI